MSEQLQALRTHLSVVKQSPADQIEEQFYNLMVRAKDQLGENSYQMAHFYYQYSNFILTRLEKNIDLFNAEAVPSNLQNNQEDQLDEIVQDFEDSTPLNSQQQSLRENQGEPNQESLKQPKQESISNAALNNEQKGMNQQQGRDQQNEQKEIGKPACEQEPNDEEMDDKELCAVNLEFAITILQNQLQLICKHQSEISEEDALNGLRRCRSRLADLLAIDENYQRAIQQYRKVIVQEQTRKGAKHNRLISELYFLVGNCFLYDNRPGCETEAILSYIRSAEILISNLCIVEEYDSAGIVAPTLQQVQVDRFPFLNRVSDSEAIKEIKEVITCLLDKIQDTYEQIGVKGAYEAERIKQEEEKKKMQFKPVAENVQVINLGSFGNRKRKPEPQKGHQESKPVVGEQLQQKQSKSEIKQKAQQGSIGKENQSSHINNDSLQ